MVTSIWARIWHDHGRSDSGTEASRLRPVVDLRAVVNIKDVHNAAVLIDPVDDAIGAAPGRHDNPLEARTAACQLAEN
jgi:hypothetical protein